MKRIAVSFALLLASPGAFATWDEQPAPPALCTRIVQVSQTDDFLVVNGQMRVRKSKTNLAYLSSALINPTLVVCLGSETDIWGNVDVVSVGRAEQGPVQGQSVVISRKY